MPLIQPNITNNIILYTFSYIIIYKTLNAYENIYINIEL